MQTFIRLFALAALAATVAAESHTVTFINDCGFGTPTLVQDGSIISTGAPSTFNGPLVNAIAYLQTGACGLDGEGCTVVNITLENPSDGGDSEVALTLAPEDTPAALSVYYYNGCDGTGIACPSSGLGNSNCCVVNGVCNPVQCTADDVDITITFC